MFHGNHWIPYDYMATKLNTPTPAQFPVLKYCRENNDEKENYMFGFKGWFYNTSTLKVSDFFVFFDKVQTAKGVLRTVFSKLILCYRFLGTDLVVSVFSFVFGFGLAAPWTPSRVDLSSKNVVFKKVFEACVVHLLLASSCLYQKRANNHEWVKVQSWNILKQLNQVVWFYVAKWFPLQWNSTLVFFECNGI